jgi:hypothetical protein
VRAAPTSFATRKDTILVKQQAAVEEMATKIPERSTGCKCNKRRGVRKTHFCMTHLLGKKGLEDPSSLSPRTTFLFSSLFDVSPSIPCNLFQIISSFESTTFGTAGQRDAS